MKRAIVGAIAFGACLYGQSSSASVPVGALSMQVLAVPASTPATYANVTVDASANGGDMIDVSCPNPQMVISLILPSGVEVTAANASSFGFNLLQQTNAFGATSTSGTFTPLDSYGSHTAFVLPAGSQGGVYRVKANSSAVSSSTNVTVRYVSTSAVTAGVTHDQPAYNPGNNVILSALVFNGGTPVTGATVSATILPPVSLNSTATLGNFQLVGQTTSGGFTQNTYQASLTNSGASAYPYAIATLTNVPASVTQLDPGRLGFFGVPAAGSTASLNTFSVQLASGQSFDPTSLRWDISTTGTPATIPMPDSGQFDSATGDGMYTGVYVPATPGVYTVLVNVSGNANGGAFVRNAVTTFNVVSPLATLSGVTDSAVSTANGCVDHLVISAQVSVQTAGNYSFMVSLKGSNGGITRAAGFASLSAGTGQINANFAARRVRTLGVDGPYEKIGATVMYVPGGNQSPVQIGQIADAGPTAPYTLASLSLGNLSFTGQNSVAGIITGSGPTFDLLRVTIGVNNVASRSCDWSAGLTDLSGNLIDFRSNYGTVSAGTTAVTLDFNGNVIARAVNGPYLVRGFAIHCAPDQAFLPPFQTQLFTASQFTNVAADFRLAFNRTPSSGSPGASFNWGILGTSIGAFSGTVNLTFSGLPAGASGQFNIPVILGFGPAALIVATSASTPAGVYPITITGTSGTLSHSISTTMTVTASNATTITTAANASAPYSASNQTVALSAAVTSPAGIVNTGTVTFTVLQGSLGIGNAVSSAVTNGSASANFTLPGGTAAGSYTIQAVYYPGAGFSTSTDSSHTLTVTSVVVATPTFSPPPGVYATAQAVAISTATPGASIRYTTNGTAPSETAGTLYAGAITVTSSTTIKAIAYESGMTDSAVVAAAYAITQPTTTAAANASATYSASGQVVALSATVTSSGGTVGTGTVTFTLLQGTTIIGSPVASGPVTNGAASANYTLPGGTAAGAYTIVAVYNAGAGFVTSSDSTHTLTVFTGAAPGSGTTCSGIYNGTFNGNLTVSPGQNCVFIGGGVTGNVQQTGGNLVLTQSQVGGDVQMNGGGTFTIGPGAAIKGNLQIQNLPSGAGQNQVCGSTVNGDLQFQNSGTAIEIGSTSPSCAGNTIGGNLTVQNNSAATVVDGNTVAGNLQDQNNTAPTQVFNNAVKQNLQCQNNSSITGGGNTAGQKQGQCAAF